MARIVVEGAHVEFPIYHGNSRSLKKTMLAAAQNKVRTRSEARLGEDAQHRVVVQALKDIDFTLRPGDRLGLIGGNGAGKTTLLRTLAGIYEPTRGRVHVEGSLGVLLDASMGMNSELSGRENIMLRGLYNGMSRAQINALEEDVAEFADLGEFLDLPVRFYSSGMVVRLAFGMATAIHPQVLLMDEWFMAGDANFLDKARHRLETLVRDAEILVLSSHLENIVLEWATRVIWLDGGRIREDGPAAEVLSHYLGREVGQEPAPATRTEETV